ncbi:SDR family oxidoreductase [Paenibacillus hexagrammi]|uniref:SDR family oxidoreductase n=1 Tax=Paenibacillus hexagrammi TaxID=2908839 RepID=A0ABY3SQC0_9BACL|nr:SDR family oxidoreductase [Paenibacillus sp. YPD9-1]UJF35439.1 SDR family oxidoreductase [Paenibacillus sp. YPD9-1]
MKVLFIGGTGLISEAVSKLTVAKGHELVLLNRGARSSFVPEGARVLVGDIRDVNAVSQLLKDEEFDVVVDWIAFTPDHAQNDLKLFAGKTKQYIYISSASAYQKPLQHYLVTEETPLENPFWQYSRDKIACEQLLMEAYQTNGFPVTIVRPSYTYGDTMIPASLNSWQYPWSLVDRMRQGKKIIVHGDGASLWTMTHNSDFAKGFVGLLGHPDAIGEAFHITSDEVLTWDQIYKAIGAAAGVEPNLVHMSSDFLCARNPELVGGLFGDKAVSAVFDNSKIKRFVPEFKANVPFAEGIKRTVEYFEAHPERCQTDEAWNAAMDAMIEAFEAGIRS